MKKTVLLAVSLFLALCIQAQNVDKERIKYSYLRNPLEKLDPGIKMYALEVQVPWLEQEKQKEVDYQADLAKAEEEYNAAVESYKSKSVGAKLAEKALLGDGKPEKRTVKKPIFIPQPDLTSIKSSISLDGFAEGSDNAVLIKVVYHDIYIGEPIDKESKSLDKTFKSRGVSVKQPVEYSLISPDGKVLYNEILEGSNNGIEIRSDEIPTLEWNAFLKEKWNAVYQTRLIDYYQKLGRDVNNAINNRFGYSKIGRNTILFMGSGKKHSYDKHLLALRKAQRAYEVLYNEREASVEKLKEAIEIWAKELEESAPEDKKARISGDVTQALIVNIVEAKTLIGDYSGAMDYCDKIDLMADAKKKYTRDIDELRALIRDEKERNQK